MKRPLNVRGLAVLAFLLALAGCGNSSEEAAPKVLIPQFVVTSAVDCADNTTLDYDVCASLLQKAIAQHDKTATAYTKLADCEKAEGTNHCNRMGEKKYTPRIAAFQITMHEQPVAEPLYPSKKGTASFRTAANVEVLPDAESYTFTKSAADASHLFTGGKKKSSGMF